ncbi:MAG: S9 family peptidase [Proteobacteria bacterium]|nr:S9 family peptidase [Pseudomonadota bacterium]
MKTATLFACAALASFGIGANAASFSFDDVAKLVSLSDPQISPDGKSIVVVRSTPDWKTDKNKLELDLVDAKTGAQRALTFEREGVSSPRWSPDGTRLAFLAKSALPKDADGKDGDAKDDGDAKAQIFVMSMSGGDAVRITKAIQGVDEFTWSPDGTRIAFLTEDPPVNEKAIKEHNKSFQVTDGHFLLREALAPTHAWIVSTKGGDAKQLTHGTYSLKNDQDAPAPLVFSRDGKRIVFTKYPSPYWGPSFRSVIASVGVDGGEPQTLVDAQGSTDFAYAPDSDRFAFRRSRNGDQNNGNAVYVGVGGKISDATAALARNFNGYAWLPNGKALLTFGELGTNSVIWEQPVDGKAKLLDLGDVQVSSALSVSTHGAFAFIGATSTQPAELYVMESPQAKPRRLTDVNAFVAKLDLGRSESIAWKTEDGFNADGVLTYPPGFDKAKKYPLVLQIHGGPEAGSTARFSPLTQLLAAPGFIVFQPNYRGSTNLGDAYQHAIFRDTGAGPGKDVMAGVDAVNKLGFVDANRIGVSGWSYGGYMTTWLTGHYAIWKAAVSGAALTDWVMDYTIAYYQMGDTYFFGGSPWIAKYADIWREQSPIQYAQNVKAPTLIMGDVGDPNVPLVNSYEWYHALRDNGVEVQFVAYPADTHFPRDIVQTVDVYRRWVGWMETYLK